MLRSFMAYQHDESIQIKNCQGTSLPFLLLIITGYIGGIAAKVISGNINYVLIVYLINLAIVLLNLAVYFRNVAIDKKSERKISFVPARA